MNTVCTYTEAEQETPRSSLPALDPLITDRWLLAVPKGSDNKNPLHAAFVLPPTVLPRSGRSSCLALAPHTEAAARLKDLGQTKLNLANKA